MACSTPRVEGALIIAGIDPYIGILHRDDYGRPVLVYDVIEIFRVWADYVVFSILGQQFVDDGYYSVDVGGAVWLEGPGRRAVSQSMADYMDEVVDLDGLRRSRSVHIGLYANRLADSMRRCMSAVGDAPNP